MRPQGIGPQALTGWAQRGGGRSEQRLSPPGSSGWKRRRLDSSGPASWAQWQLRGVPQPRHRPGPGAQTVALPQAPPATSHGRSRGWALRPTKSPVTQPRLCGASPHCTKGREGSEKSSSRVQFAFPLPQADAPQRCLTAGPQPGPPGPCAWGPFLRPTKGPTRAPHMQLCSETKFLWTWNPQLAENRAQSHCPWPGHFLPGPLDFPFPTPPRGHLYGEEGC